MYTRIFRYRCEQCLGKVNGQYSNLTFVIISYRLLLFNRSLAIQSSSRSRIKAGCQTIVSLFGGQDLSLLNLLKGDYYNKFDPSVVAAVIFAVLYTACCAITTFQYFWYRCWFWLFLVIASWSRIATSRPFNPVLIFTSGSRWVYWPSSVSETYTR